MRWSEVVEAAPALAPVVQGRFEAHLHHVLATVRPDGAPRTSGTEVRFVDGDVWLGMMPGSAKGRDLRRDPRLELHAAPIDVELAVGDATLRGRAEEVTDDAAIRHHLEQVGHPAEPDEPLDAELFRVDVEEIRLVRVADELLHVDRWSTADGVGHVERR